MMATNRTIAKSMLMGIVTTVFIGFGFSACTANEDSPTPPEVQHDYSAYEAYGLTYHNFDDADDVKILNADTTIIAVKKTLADKLGIGPRLGAEAELTVSPDGIDYKQEVNMRLQAWAGAKVEILGYKLAEWSTRFDLAGPWTILKYPEE